MNQINQPAPCRVKIISCNAYPKGWYTDSIGEEFDVDHAGGVYDYVVWEDYINRSASQRHIAKQDCIRVPITTP